MGDAAIMATIYENCLERILAGDFGLAELCIALSPAMDTEHLQLIETADRVRHRSVGDDVHLRALIEFSNHCTRSCHYCGLRVDNDALPRYRMSADEIVEAAKHATGLGYQTVVLQSGEDDWYTARMLADVVRRIKAHCDVAVTLCVGERPLEDYALWREAGADRYLLRIETSDPGLYAILHPEMSYTDRCTCLKEIRKLGYELGSGVLVGLPGQTVDMLAQDLLFLKELNADMVGIGPLIPHPQTPLAQCETGSVEMTLRMMALTRLLLPKAHIVATTALGTLDPLGRERGLAAGGNVVMPNVTPQKYRALYEIYPSKICIDETPEKCRGCIEARICSVGRNASVNRGKAIRKIPA